MQFLIFHCAVIILSAPPSNMTAESKTKPSAHRDFFVLTAEEKRIIAFVVVAFVLGLGTKCYRDQNRARDPAGAPVKTIERKSVLEPSPSMRHR